MSNAVFSSLKLITEPNELSQWHTLIQQAEQNYGCTLNETMESYLVFTLMRFMRQHNIGAQALAMDYLKAQRLPNALRHNQLRDVGDHCLILSGLFPQRADKRLVRVSYYVNLGRTAYQHLAEQIHQTSAELYHQLADTFVLLMDLLQTIRAFNSPALQPIQAHELWSDTGSRRAFTVLNDHATPLHESLLDSAIRH